MSNTVKTTRIEKKYKDKKTGEYKTITIDYAKVVDRLNEFRGANPRGLIETSPSMQGDMIFFKAHILKDKSDENSAEATGHAVGKNDGSEKVFEKLETLAVGRALAMLGYAAGGEIASFEEMEDFKQYQDELIDNTVNTINSFTQLDELKQYFLSLKGNLMAHSKVIAAKDAKKKELTNADNRG